MPGPVPGIHVFFPGVNKTWMAGTSPAMTALNGVSCCTAGGGMLGHETISVACKGVPAPATNPKSHLDFNGLAPVAPGLRLLKDLKTVAGEGAHSVAHLPGMAGRYATALFDLALEENAIDAVRADLDRFDALLDDSPDLLRLVRSPVFTAEEQVRALRAVLDGTGFTGLAAKFVLAVATNRRLFAVREMIRDYRELVARHKGEVTAQVTLAQPPREHHLTAIKEALAAVTHKHVQVNVTVDPSLIGGLIVKLGSRMVDTSLRTKLQMIKHAMKEAS
jgi:F-type H+-transporting ATPase subunit delta